MPPPSVLDFPRPSASLLSGGDRTADWARPRCRGTTKAETAQPRQDSPRLQGASGRLSSTGQAPRQRPGLEQARADPAGGTGQPQAGDAGWPRRRASRSRPAASKSGHSAAKSQHDDRHVSWWPTGFTFRLKTSTKERRALWDPHRTYSQWGECPCQYLICSDSWAKPVPHAERKPGGPLSLRDGRRETTAAASQFSFGGVGNAEPSWRAGRRGSH